MLAKILIGIVLGAFAGYLYKAAGIDLRWLFSGAGDTVSSLDPIIMFSVAGALAGLFFGWADR